MDKNSKFKALFLLDSYVKSGAIPPSVGKDLASFLLSHISATGNQEMSNTIFVSFFEEVKKQCKDPYPFPPNHKKLRKPIDYAQLGLSILRPLVVKDKSTLTGIKNLEKIEKEIAQKHNVVFLANHQTEADPQVIFIMLEEKFFLLAEEMIFVAGERVVTDPLAIPFSMGCNLLCIYSKRYIDQPKELKHTKQLHNKKTMELMGKMLKKGGKCIYVAPSGGRDRRDEQGKVKLAKFDPKSIEMFFLISKKAKTPTHFYPMALSTYDILPPPDKIQVELGENRLANRIPVHIAIGNEIDMEHFPGSEKEDKQVRRNSRADYIWNLVAKDYNQLPKVTK